MENHVKSNDRPEITHAAVERMLQSRAPSRDESFVRNIESFQEQAEQRKLWA